MPLHRNVSAQEKSMAFKGEDTFIKEITNFQENALLYSHKLQAFQMSAWSRNSFLKVKEFKQKY